MRSGIGTFRIYAVGLGALTITACSVGLAPPGDARAEDSAGIGSTTIDSVVNEIVELPPDASKDELEQIIDSKIFDLVPKHAAAEMRELREEGVTLFQLDRTYQIEMERTDKQLGAGASSSGSTSVVEKAGIPWLLGLAIENGAITQSSDETGLTLSTSPYALLKLGKEDTPDLYTGYGTPLDLARRIGISAVFPLSSDGTADERNFDPETFSEATAKVVVWGDRNPRSPRYVAEWDRKILPQVRKRLEQDTLLAQAVLDDPVVRSAVERISSAVMRRVEAKRSASPQSAMLASDLKAVFEEEIGEGLKAIDPARWEEARRQAVVAAARRTAVAYSTVGAEGKDLQEMLDKLAKSPEVSFAYTYHHKLDDVDYSEIKLLADIQTEYVDILGNAIVSFNHGDGVLTNSEGQVLHRDGFRNCSVSVALEKRFRNFFPVRVNDGGLSEVTLSLSGRFEHLQDVDDNIGVGQAKIVIPLATGVDLPISMTYASRSEYIDEEEVRGNFGISIDTDKIYSLAKLYTTGLRN